MQTQQQATESAAGAAVQPNVGNIKQSQYMYHLVLNEDLRQTDMGTFLEQMLLENMISFRYSNKVFPNSIMWLQAKAKGPQAQNEMSPASFEFEQEFTLLYFNSYTFQRDHENGDLMKNMAKVKHFMTQMRAQQVQLTKGAQGQDVLDDGAGQAPYKVVVLFNSVSDSLLNPSNPQQQIAKQANSTTTLAALRKFQLALTLEFEFDYLEVYTPVEVVDFLKEMHFSIVDKPHRKELSMYSQRGFRPGRKAQVQGFAGNTLALNYISWLMCIPSISETKAIAIAKTYPTLDSLYKAIMNGGETDKEVIAKLMEIPVAGAVAGDKAKKLGKALAKRLYEYFCAVDPVLVIN